MHLRWLKAAVLVALVLPFCWCFGATLTGTRICGYRDAAYFYYPLYHWTSESWRRGEIPLWNPQEGLGSPIAAEATSAVFYPGQVMFALPVRYPWKFSLYIALHVLLAAGGAYVLARVVLAQRNCDRLARHPSDRRSDRRQPDRSAASVWDIQSAGLCALSYAFGGAVLFQYCNIVFLVGAAWLPWALVAALQLAARRELPWALALGVFLALMVLGGDPQSAYHAGLLGAWWMWHQRSDVRSASVTAERRSRFRTRLRSLCHAVLLLAVAAISGVCLCAVQVIASLDWASQSNRAAFEYPRSVYEVPAYLQRSPEGPDEIVVGDRYASDRAHDWRGVAKGLFGPPVAGTHHQQIYAFSLVPWRLCELVWPNFTGAMFPTNRRWPAALGLEDRVWTPTIYLGIMPLLIALLAWRQRKDNDHPEIGWWGWVAGVSLIASFGGYGLGGVAKGIGFVFAGESWARAVGDATGGLYWFLVTALPAYSYFRYPAKLVVIAALAISVLAALGFERALTADRLRLRRSLLTAGLCSAVMLCLVTLCGLWWNRWMAGARPDELYGPLDVRGAWLSCLMACLHACVICWVGIKLLRHASRFPIQAGVLVLLVSALELGWANGSSVLTVPADVMEARSVVDPRPEDAPSLIRVYRSPERQWVPSRWIESSTDNRAAETVRWDRATLFPKYHLLTPLGSIAPLQTVASHRYALLLETLGQGHPRSYLLRALAIHYVIAPSDDNWPAGLAAPAVTASVADNVRVWRVTAPFPRAWIVHRVQWQQPNHSRAPSEIRRQIHKVMFADDELRDLAREAVVEQPRSRTLPPVELPPSPLAAESCDVLEESLGQMVLEVKLRAAGLVVLSNLYEDNWTVYIQSRPVAGEATRADRGTIVRTNGVMQGVFLPVGEHRLTFTYRPRRVYWAAAVSIAAWCAVVGGGVWVLTRRRQALSSRVHLVRQNRR